MPVRLDASLGFETSLAETPGVARDAENAGVAALWTAETSHDPFLPLALAAEHTERLELGTAIAVAFARSPTAVAATAWDLSRLSGGRFLLGLGTQVRAHVERRFGMPWSGRPVSQLREYVGVVRAAWSAWQSGERPAFRGEHYRLTLMSPFFDPGPIEHPSIPVYLAGVGAGMTALAGEIGDGLIVHPLHSRAYLADVVLPAVQGGAAGAGRDPSAVTVAASVILATDEEEAAAARRTIAFYASTPTYRPVLEHHGWGSVADALANHARRGRWDEMAALVTLEMLETFAVVASPDGVRDALERRAEGLVDRVAPYQPFGAPVWRSLRA
ncbi:MAG TPA: TIGR03617 family F420-dependent LLM class oxidoreductase [Candidatus Limnocylindria bacterium]|nr:TIGR03617 family F420-dependent LLM class oxidoreductase [Candidatus Limnocylindria bacterium]